MPTWFYTLQTTYKIAVCAVISRFRGHLQMTSAERGEGGGYHISDAVRGGCVILVL